MHMFQCAHCCVHVGKDKGAILAVRSGGSKQVADSEGFVQDLESQQVCHCLLVLYFSLVVAKAFFEQCIVSGYVYTVWLVLFEG